MPPSLAKRGPPSNTVYAGLVLVFDLKALGWADTLSTERVTMLSCSQWLSGSGIKKEPEGKTNDQSEQRAISRVNLGVEGSNFDSVEF